MESRREAGCRPSCGAPTRPGAACASKCPGSSASRPPIILRPYPLHHAAVRRARQTLPQAWPTSSTRSAPTRCSCSRRTIRTGSSTATIRCRRICRRASLSRMCADNPLETFPRLKLDRMKVVPVDDHAADVDRPPHPRQEEDRQHAAAHHRLRRASEHPFACRSQRSSCRSAGRSICATYGSHLRTPISAPRPIRAPRR